MKKKSIWITWHHSSRSRNMAEALDAELFEIFLNKNIIQRHLGSSLWTLKILYKKKPDVIYLQYSFLLLFILAVYKLLRLKKVTLIADCHTKALRRKASGIFNVVFWPIKRWTFKVSDAAIVHNNGMKGDIEKLHTNYFVIPDKIPSNSFKHKKDSGRKYCINISSFAVDEPVEEVIDAARELEKDNIDILWTGKVPHDIKARADLPSNLKFTGYVSFEEFYNLLGNANCSMALTTEEDCLQSGAYESLDFEIPMVLSDTATLRNYFGGAAIYADIDPMELAAAIREAMIKEQELRVKMKELKSIRNEEHAQLLDKLKEVIN